MELTNEQGAELIRAAREAITHFFEFSEEPSVLRGVDLDRYSEPRGVFVTLRRKGELRGCIGFPFPTFPLGRAVVKSALGAAFEDFRFAPLTKQELPQIRIELSVLTVPERVKVRGPSDYLEKIKIGRDGLIIRYGMNTGLLLPQVPGEQGWGVEEYLEGLCMKAGLPAETWKEKGVSIEAFQAQIFEEKRGK
jgi:uncharacterized protein (TIGR00296 family)